MQKLQVKKALNSSVLQILSSDNKHSVLCPADGGCAGTQKTKNIVKDITIEMFLLTKLSKKRNYTYRT